MTLAVLDGRFVPAESLALSVTDPGVTHGAMVTDVCRTYGGRLFRHADHVARFVRDCAACFVPVPERLGEWSRALVGRNAGPGELLLNTVATPRTWWMRTTPLDEGRYRAFFTEGVALWPTPPHPASGLLPPTVKHRNRLPWWVAEHLAPPGAVALTTDERGHLLETAVGNLLFVRDGVVLFSPAGTVLDGISQRVVRELCGREGITAREEPLTADADEALLCGTAFGVAGVRRVGGREYAWPGPVTRQLLAAWEAEVGR